MGEILTRENVIASGTAGSKDDAIREVGRLLVASDSVTEAYVDAMFERERSVSTYMGNYLAIPHGTNEAKDEIRSSALAFVRYDEPLDWGGDEVRFVVGIAGVGDEHLGILSKIAILFSDEDDVERLLSAPDADALYSLLGEVNEE